jgi:MYXO-CTERM domain-containing protein
MERMYESSWYRLGLIAMLAVTLFACSGGGGCSSCAGCGVQPIPGAFRLEDRIPRSAQVRLTSNGIGFIENNISSIVGTVLPTGLDFPIPRTETSFDVPLIGNTDVDVCPGGDCQIHIEIQSLDLTPTAPNRLSMLLRVILETRDATGARRGLPIRLVGGCGFLGCAINTTCNADIDTRRGDRVFVGIAANIDFNEEGRPARIGYTRIDVGDADLAPGEDIEDADIEFGACDGASGALINLVSGLLTGTLVDQLQGQVSSLLNSAIADQLCQTRGDYGCPTGTFAVPDESPTSVCRYENNPDAQCVPILLGTDGQGDLGDAFLGGFSPGTHGYGQFLLASGGQGVAVNDGMSLFFYGGFRSTDRTFAISPAHNACVPELPPPPLPEIPQAAAFLGNTIPGVTTPEGTPHVGIGLAEDYLNYAGYGAFDSGMLCLGAGTRLSQQLSTGLVSALIMSLNDLTFPSDNSPLTIAVRPQQPPVFSIGSGAEGDPLLQIALNTLELDFYVWSTERYVRFMTFQTDLTIGVDLSVEGTQLVPNIRSIAAANSSVRNSELLGERPDLLASTLETVIQSFAGMLTSGISPFDLPSIMGFNLEVPPGGITRVSEGGDDFLGIFANLAVAGPAPLVREVETRVEVSDLTLDRDSMDPARWGQGEGNSLWVTFAAEGPAGVDYEYSYRIDGGPWSAWTRDSRVRVNSDVLLLQARHELEARARVVGEPASVDSTPASAPVLVDILPPTVSLSRTAEGVEVEASDVLTAAENLEIRFLVGGTWTEWGHSLRLALPYDDAEGVSAEVRDEAGNVGRAQAALIRGLPDPSATGGCGCSAPGTGSGGLPLGLLGLAGLAAVFLARRRKGGRLATFLSLLALPLLVTGCECSAPPMGEPCEGSCRDARLPNTRGSVCCESSNMCVDYDLNDLCDPGYQCRPEDVVLDDACAPSCSECRVRPALEPGILATHLDALVEDDGTVSISGYSPGVADGSSSRPYGDLVFGRWDSTSELAGVTWEIVDGAPSMPVTNDPNGWRRGVSDPGDDVGQWTSLAQVGEGYIISYYDTSNGALKVAQGSPGSWQVHTVDGAGDSGRYSSLVVTPEGIPAIAYLRIRESAEVPGQVVSTVMVATANVAAPSSSADWTLTEVTTSAMPCRAQFCTSAPTCLASGLCVNTTSDCATDCASPQVCFNGACVDSVPANFVEDLVPAVGLYVSLAVNPAGGLGLVYYDRTAGNVRGVRFDGAAWSAPFLIDGYALGDPAVGDSGMSADLTIDAGGVWHLTYVDGAEETLRYARVQPDGTVASREVVDDGSTTDGTTRHEDGRHIVGDDASIAVLEGGAIRIAYQDATSQDLVIAARAAEGGPWTIARLDTEGSTGYWNVQDLLGVTSYVVTWWRSRDGRDQENGVRVLVAE